LNNAVMLCLAVYASLQTTQPVIANGSHSSEPNYRNCRTQQHGRTKTLWTRLFAKMAERTDRRTDTFIPVHTLEKH